MQDILRTHKDLSARATKDIQNKNGSHYSGCYLSAQYSHEFYFINFIRYPIVALHAECARKLVDYIYPARASPLVELAKGKGNAMALLPNYREEFSLARKAFWTRMKSSYSRHVMRGVHILSGWFEYNLYARYFAQARTLLKGKAKRARDDRLNCRQTRILHSAQFL